MRTATVSLCVLAFTAAVSGQAVAPSVGPLDAVLHARQIQIGASEPQVLRDGGLAIKSRVVANDVEIRIGSALITADEAEIRNGALGQPSEIDLRGNVRLKAVLQVP